MADGYDNPVKRKHPKGDEEERIMKKFAVMLMVLVALMMSVSAVADGLWYDGYQWWLVGVDGNLFEINTPPMSWDTCLANYQFPETVIRDRSDLCRRYNGTPVGCLGLVSNRGSNLRSKPTLDGSTYMTADGARDFNHATIIRKLHANTTVYVYFRFYDQSGKEWYYVTCSDGVEGMLVASRIMLIDV